MPIHWPDRYAPAATAVHVSNAIAIAAPPQAVWGVLLRAVDWPDWYPNSANVRIAGGDTELAQGRSFKWKTFGIPVASTVREFVAPERLAWDGGGPLMDVYHAWLIEPRGAGSWVLTQENQNGLAARAQALLAPHRMHKGHQLWLERLKAVAEARWAKR